MTQGPASRGPCPYCQESPPVAKYERREHVIPQAFGRFEQNLIAWNVCDACNEYFDRELDRVLARGTYEGFLRFRHGNKPAREYRHAGRDTRLWFKACSGPWTGMHLRHRLSTQGDALMLEPAKQIGFSATKSDKPTYYLVEETPLKERCREIFGDEVFFSAVGFTSEEEVRTVLRSLGFGEMGELQTEHGIVSENTMIRVEQVAKADRRVFRAIAKIAMNYLDARFPQLSRMEIFYDICHFVRRDRVPSFSPVRASFGPIIGNEPAGHRFLGHVVTLRYDPRRDEIMAIVSLYNQIRYDVLLSPTGFITVVDPEFMTAGNFFDTKNGVVCDLTHASQMWRRLLIENA